MHPHPSFVVAPQRRTFCPCGAYTGRPNTLCRKCRHTALWLRHSRRTKYADRAVRRMARHGGRQTPALLGLVLFLRGARP